MAPRLISAHYRRIAVLKQMVDLGLLRRDGAGGLVVANPIYRHRAGAAEP